MRKNVILSLLALLVSLSACTSENMRPAREVAVANQFGVEIPGNLVPCFEMHEFAPLQYADERGGYFLLGITEPKEDLADLKVEYELSDYASFVESTVASTYDSVQVTQRDTLEINGLHCQTSDLLVTVKGGSAPLEVYYHISVFESKDHFYQLIGWSPREKQEVFQAAARDMDHSFHELKSAMAFRQTASAVGSKRN